MHRRARTRCEHEPRPEHSARVRTNFADEFRNEHAGRVGLVFRFSDTAVPIARMNIYRRLPSARAHASPEYRTPNQRRTRPRRMSYGGMAAAGKWRAARHLRSQSECNQGAIRGRVDFFATRSLRVDVRRATEPPRET